MPGPYTAEVFSIVQLWRMGRVPRSLISHL